MSGRWNVEAHGGAELTERWRDLCRRFGISLKTCYALLAT
jgi:hypothetical protein